MPAFTTNSVVLHICFAVTSLFFGYRQTGEVEPRGVVEVARAAHQLYTFEEEAQPEPCPACDSCPTLGDLLRAEFSRRRQQIAAGIAVILSVLGAFFGRWLRQPEEYGTERRRVFEELAAAGVPARAVKRRPQLMAA